MNTLNLRWIHLPPPDYQQKQKGRVSRTMGLSTKDTSVVECVVQGVNVNVNVYII